MLTSLFDNCNYCLDSEHERILFDNSFEMSSLTFARSMSLVEKNSICFVFQASFLENLDCYNSIVFIPKQMFESISDIYYEIEFSFSREFTLILIKPSAQMFNLKINI